MNRTLTSLRTGLLALAALLPARLGAQPSPPATVSATGVAEVKRQPEALRVQIELLARGKTLPEALAKLKDRREAARVELARLGAAKESVVFGDVVSTSEKTEQQVQMERMMRQRDRALGKKAGKAKQEPPAVVAVTVRADFPLAAAGADAFLLAAHALQDKVKAADLGGVKETQKLSPQEEEVAEEMELAQAGGDGGETKRGEPAFLYVCKIREEDRDRALADAFAKAKREAARLARSADAELAGLSGLSNQSLAGPEAEEMSGMSRQMYYAAMQQARGAQVAAFDAEGESVGLQPGKVTLRVSVTAQFLLRPAHDK